MLESYQNEKSLEEGFGPFLYQLWATTTGLAVLGELPLRLALQHRLPGLFPELRFPCLCKKFDFKELTFSIQFSDKKCFSLEEAHRVRQVLLEELSGT